MPTAGVVKRNCEFTFLRPSKIPSGDRLVKFGLADRGSNPTADSRTPGGATKHSAARSRRSHHLGALKHEDPSHHRDGRQTVLPRIRAKQQHRSTHPAYNLFGLWWKVLPMKKVRYRERLHDHDSQFPPTTSPISISPIRIFAGSRGPRLP